MDEQILGSLFLQGVPVFDMESGMSSVDVGWGTPIFHAMGREKITLINIFLSMNFELLMCDTDMVWLRVREALEHLFECLIENFNSTY